MRSILDTGWMLGSLAMIDSGRSVVIDDLDNVGITVLSAEADVPMVLKTGGFLNSRLLHAGLVPA